MAEHTLSTPEQKITDSLRHKIGELVLMELAHYITSNARLSAHKFSETIPMELIGALESLHLGEVREMSRLFAEKYIIFNLDFSSLVLDFAQERIRKNILEELIKNQASHNYIKKTTGYNIREINNAERMLNVSSSRIGKKIHREEYGYIRIVYEETLELFKDSDFSQAKSLIATSKKTGYKIFRIEDIIF